MSYQKQLLGQQLGAYVYKDPPIVISDHDLAESAGTFWTTDSAIHAAQTATLNSINVAWESDDDTQTLFWGDGTNETIDSGVNEVKSWPIIPLPIFPLQLFANAEITNTRNTYMSGNYMRGSSRLYTKLI